MAVGGVRRGRTPHGDQARHPSSRLVSSPAHNNNILWYPGAGEVLVLSLNPPPATFGPGNFPGCPGQGTGPLRLSLINSLIPPGLAPNPGNHYNTNHLNILSNTEASLSSGFEFISRGGKTVILRLNCRRTRMRVCCGFLPPLLQAPNQRLRATSEQFSRQF